MGAHIIRIIYFCIFIQAMMRRVACVQSPREPRLGESAVRRRRGRTARSLPPESLVFMRPVGSDAHGALQP
jgi:hypothetical protein